MAKKKVNKDAWLTTYGDMITLILTFFILLFSMSTIDLQKWAVIVQVFSRADLSTQIVIEKPEIEGEMLPASNGETTMIGEKTEPTEIADGNEEMPIQEEFLPSGATEVMEEEMMKQNNSAMEALASFMGQFVKENQLEQKVDVGEGDGFVIMRFEGDLFFGPDSSSLLPAGKEALDYLMAGLSVIEDEVGLIRVDGHTADTGIINPSASIGRKLSSDRANNVVVYLEEKDTIDPAKMIAVGYGKYRPIADNSTEEGRAKNRRVEIYIAEDATVDIDIDEIYKTLAPDDNQGDTGISSIGNNMNLDEIYQSLSPDVGE